MSATRCSRCSSGLEHLVSEDPLNSEANYSCEKCSNSQRATQIRTGNTTIANELKELNRSKLENLMGFLTQYEPILGPTNAHVVEIKYAVVMLLANRKPYILAQVWTTLPRVWIGRSAPNCEETWRLITLSSDCFGFF